LRNWLVVAGTRVALVRARRQSEAITAARELFAVRNGRRTLAAGYADIRVRRATRRDVELFESARAQVQAWTQR